MARYADTLSIFLNMFPNYINRVRSWQPNGRHAITLELENEQYIVFAYRNENDWTLKPIVNRRKK